MKQAQDICLPSGFSVAGTYSGLCDSRVKLDTAMIASRTRCSIVIAGETNAIYKQGKALLLHNGAALPEGKRGQEISREICSAAAAYFHVSCQDVAFLANGMAGQYFRPSLLINSLATLAASLSPAHGDQVGAVLDNLGDISFGAVALGASPCTLSGLAADGTDAKPGVCLLLTDAAASQQQLYDAVSACRQEMNLEGYTVVAVANGAAGGALPPANFAQAVKGMFAALGFQPSLQACS